jgi:twitching motility protein PilT
VDITQLLAFSVKNKASDLHLSAGLPPMIRVHGDVRRINVEALDHKMVHGMVYDIMNDGQRKHFEEFLEIDFSFEIDGLARFRVNAFNHNRGAGAVFRTIPSKILSLEQLNAPKIFGDLALKPRGMVLVTGPTGSGKSTTLAAMVNYLNETEFGHILTVEDPIEFVSSPRSAWSTNVRWGRTRCRLRPPCAPLCGKTRTAFWSVKCAIWRPSAWP